MFVYKELSFKKLLEVSRDSAVTCAQVLVLVAAAQAFGWFLTVARVPQTISTALLENINSAWLFLVLINVILIIVGMFMEGIAAIIILGPLFYPIAVSPMRLCCSSMIKRISESTLK
jgi:C4-dicarboxylate transporter DctM subunit